MKTGKSREIEWPTSTCIGKQTDRASRPARHPSSPRPAERFDLYQLDLVHAFSNLGFPSKKELAAHLDISSSALTRRLDRIQAKLGTQNTSQLVRLLTALEILKRAKGQIGEQTLDKDPPQGEAGTTKGRRLAARKNGGTR